MATRYPQTVAVLSGASARPGPAWDDFLGEVRARAVAAIAKSGVFITEQDPGTNRRSSYVRVVASTRSRIITAVCAGIGRLLNDWPVPSPR